jgi:methanol metabolism-related c-type cytochrome
LKNQARERVGGWFSVKAFVARSFMAASILCTSGVVVLADPPGDPTAVKQDADGYWRDKNGDPTYKVEADGTVDFPTFSGFRRYHSDCHVCHGPDGEGSSYAPALANSLKTMDYSTFAGIVVNGRKNLINGNENVMPSFAENKNVTCYLNDIYVYLRARSQDAIPRGRPAKHEPKPATFDANETKCMAGD